MSNKNIWLQQFSEKLDDKPKEEHFCTVVTIFVFYAHTENILLICKNIT